MNGRVSAESEQLLARFNIEPLRFQHMIKVVWLMGE